MLALRDARERRARLALASRAQGNDLAPREFGEDGLIVEMKIGVEIAGRLRRLDHAEHGPADDDKLAAGGASGLGDGAETGDVRSEGGDCDPIRRLADQPRQYQSHVGLGGRHPVADGIGGIADERRDAIVSERFQPCHVGRSARERVVVELPVAGVESGAKRRPDHHGRRLGDRMGHADQLDIERADLAAIPHRDDLQGEAVDEADLGELRFEHLGGEGRGVDRDSGERGPQIGHGAEMIFMRVGEQEPGDIVPLFLDEPNVGKDHIDAGLGLAAEGDAHIDDEPFAGALAAVAVEVEIHADLAHAAERQEDEIGFRCVRFARHSRGRDLVAQEEDIAGGDTILAVGRHQPERAVGIEAAIHSLGLLAMDLDA